MRRITSGIATSADIRGRCATLDCHGSIDQSLRLADTGLRAADELRSAAITPELIANLRAVAATIRTPRPIVTWCSPSPWPRPAPHGGDVWPDREDSSTSGAVLGELQQQAPQRAVVPHRRQATASAQPHTGVNQPHRCATRPWTTSSKCCFSRAVTDRCRHRRSGADRSIAPA